MGDLSFSLLVLAGLAWVSFRLGRAWGDRVSTRGANLIAGLTLAAMVAYIAWLWDHVAMARLLPFSNVIVLGNWFPLAAGFLSGLAVAQAAGRGPRRWWPALALQTAAMVTVIGPLCGSAPLCLNQWGAHGVCLQTTDKTCSAASAATLLTRHGIPASEQEMAQLCLTRHGTSWMGLYRGLKLKTAGTAWDVEPFECSADELSELSGPAIVSVGLTWPGTGASIHQTEFGWKPGARHAVVVLDFVANGRVVEVADPSPEIGREFWTFADLTELYRGQGMKLVRRAK